MHSKTYFGFKEVEEGEKESLVRGVFDRVARRYDVMNDLMSLGLHRLWKREMLDWLAPRPGMRLLDVAGGTGDIAFRFLDRAHGGHVTVCDINPNMLAEGRNRAIDRNTLHGIAWVCGSAEKLPVADRSQDACTIAFGIRNVTHIDRALAEAFRVLRPGGRFLCLEFSHMTNSYLQSLYDLYSFQIIPRMGSLVAHDRTAYQYLVESIRRFPDQETFAALIAAAGFANVRYRNLSGGVVALHSARRA